MKKMIKYFNTIGLIFALCAMVISGCSCSAPKPTPNPLAGWQIEFKPVDSSVEKDAQDYMQKLPPEEKKYASWGYYYKDGTGQHAMEIEVALNGTWVYHVLIYDKDNTTNESE
jgi:hypothetical protein